VLLGPTATWAQVRASQPIRTVPIDLSMISQRAGASPHLSGVVQACGQKDHVTVSGSG
jgi:hypothetical protein